MDNLFYTYAYLREDGTPYYIGKGKGKRAFTGPHRNVPVPVKERILLLKTGLTEEEAFRHEIYMIAVYGRKDKGQGILHNFTDGGDGKSGWTTPEEVRKKQSLTKLGELNPMYGIPSELHPMYGRTHTEETKLHLSKIHTGRRWFRSPDFTEERMFHPGTEPESWTLGRKKSFGVEGWVTRRLKE
jgi:hypothetical protein